MLYWKKHQPREEEKEKEMTVLSEKGKKKITMKSEIATSLKEPFKECPIEMIEEVFQKEIQSNRN